VRPLFNPLSVIQIRARGDALLYDMAPDSFNLQPRIRVTITDSEHHLFQLESFMRAPDRELFNVYGSNIIGFVPISEQQILRTGIDPTNIVRTQTRERRYSAPRQPSRRRLRRERK
jgi:hypothetical protein